ncbi:Protein deltexlike, partial [Caligus rogercresseyi]
KTTPPPPSTYSEMDKLILRYSQFLIDPNDPLSYVPYAEVIWTQLHAMGIHLSSYSLNALIKPISPASRPASQEAAAVASYAACFRGNMPENGSMEFRVIPK